MTTLGIAIVLADVAFIAATISLCIPHRLPDLRRALIRAAVERASCNRGPLEW